MACSTCANDVPDIQLKIADFWLQASRCKEVIMDRAWASGLYGKKAVNEWYNKANNFHYLLILLLFIYEERLMDARSNACGLDQGKTYYIDKYNIKCIIKNFMCLKCNINNILAIFDLFDLNPNTTESQDGIGFMMIYPADVDCSGYEFQIY